MSRRRKTALGDAFNPDTAWQHGANGVVDPALRRDIDLLGRHMLRYLAKAFGVESTSRGRCILGAMIVRDVLLARGFEASELSVSLHVANRRGLGVLKHLSANPELSAEEKEQFSLSEKGKGAYIVQCGLPSIPPLTSDSWSGHLVTIVEGQLIDLTAAQTARPERGIRIGPLACPLRSVEPINDGDVIAALEGLDGTVVEWAAHPENVGYQCAKDYDLDRRRKIVDKLLKKLNGSMAK